MTNTSSPPRSIQARLLEEAAYFDELGEPSKLRLDALPELLREAAAALQELEDNRQFWHECHDALRAHIGKLEAAAAIDASPRRWHMAFNAALRRVTTLTPPACDGPDCVICLQAQTSMTRRDPSALDGPKQPNPCPRCGTFLWSDPRPCWNCARERASALDGGGPRIDDEKDDLTRSGESMDPPASVSTRPPTGKG